MANKQEFRLRDLTTRSVLLFPTQAQIIRDIKAVSLQTGSNQIIIDGLAPTVDEHSIKVEGTGSATITEVTVDLLPNREVYEDIYPSDSEEEDDSEDDESEAEIEAMTIINDKIKQLQEALLAEQEKVNNARNRLQICDNFGKSVEKTRPPPEDLSKLLAAYQTERENIFSDHESSTRAAEKIEKEIKESEKEKTKLAKVIVKANEKKERAKEKALEKKARKKAEIKKEKLRVKTERESFWPKKVYRITINIEPSFGTPASSRRNSIDGDTVVNLATSDFHEPSKTALKSDEISLSLSYITYDASWSPRYDLALNTIKCTGSLDYGAELRNTTSETWRDAKVILSTSQTTFSGLSEAIPTLHPWHVRLARGGGGGQGENALFSSKELQSKRNEWNTKSGLHSKKPRHEVYGRSDRKDGGLFPSSKLSRNLQVQQVMNNYAQPMQNSLFGAQSNTAPNMIGGGLFGSSSARQQVPEDNVRRKRSSGRPQFLADNDCDEEDDESDEAEEGMAYADFSAEAAAPQSLIFEEGAWEESGMTTTYDVPGLKTLAPSNSTIKHKIAKIDFKNVVFSHIVIGKLRQVAFLKARMRNASKISLLKGPLGLTLDGSFLGRATLPRCSAGETFSLPLGVDPAINISYPKPTVRRSQTGIFSKEGSNVFTRIVVVTNTKHSSPVELTVLDQVPVSEDERLKIEITHPRGLKPGSDGVKAGQSAFTAQITNTGNASSVRASVYGADGQAPKDSKWGSAVATAKKGGEIVWNVKLNPGQGVKLALEYEATFPSSESIVGVE